MFTPLSVPRSRLAIIGWLLLVIVLGLGSRRFASSLHPAIASHAGDALWTVAVYLAIAFTSPRTSPLTIGLCALTISFVVEFGQLWNPEWLLALRKTLPGKLLLGSGFLTIDLIRYTAGAIGALLIDTLMSKRQLSSPTQQIEET